MAKTMEQALRKQLDAAIDNYTKALCKQFDFDEANCWWAADDSTGVYCCSDDLFLNLADVIYIVDNNIERKDVEEWQEYCVFASEYQQSIPNLPSWVKGCPRLSNAQINRLKTLRKEFVDAMNDYNDAMKVKPI